MTQGPDHAVGAEGGQLWNESEYPKSHVDFKGHTLHIDSFKIYREEDVDWWEPSDGQYVVCTDDDCGWWEIRSSGYRRDVPETVPTYGWVYDGDEIDEDKWDEYIVEPSDGESDQSWQDVETKSPTPVADALRDFAAEVADVERTIDNDARVDVYFTGETEDDTQRISVEYGVDSS